MKWTGIFIALFATVSQATTSLRIEAYGDSLTAGMLSYTRSTEVPSLDFFRPILSDFAQFGLTQDRKWLEKNERKELAWPQRIAGWLEGQGYSAKVHNQAVSGALTASLSTRILDDPKETDSNWAFFFIGHNDICSDEKSVEQAVSDYVNEYTKALETWDQKHEGGTAYLLPMGPMDKVYMTLKDHVWFENSQRAFRCTDSWSRYFPFCLSNYRRLKSGTLEEYLHPRLDLMNEALEKLAMEWNQKSRRNRFHYIPTAWPEKLEPSQFAVDCYHTSAEGQQLLADGITGFLLRSRMIK